ncbi:MAG TPA: ABC transporter substrate-binding protein [Candidatus Binatia bacterium]|nr:ABC transporter substrate-binding protein [Candidatus Binatia bacterium]
MRKAFVCFSLFAMLFAPCSSAQAQQGAKVPLVGYLSGTAARNQEFFIKGLRELGYVNGKNISLIARYTGRPELLPKFAAELVNYKVNVIVATSEVAAQAAKEATSTIPIVVVAGGDLVRTGLVASIARPGENITGLTFFDQELAGKQLEILKEAVPTVSRVGVLWNSENATGLPIFKQIKATAPALGVELHSMDMRWSELSPGCRTVWLGPNCPDFDTAFKAAIQSRVGAFMVVASSFSFPPQSTEILELMAETSLPAMYNREDWVRRGGMMFYGASRNDMLRRAATYVDKILKGRKPADLPVERPAKFEFVVNLKTANQIGLTIPPNVLARADRVIR